MIQDALAYFADGQSGTTSAASTDIIDTLAAGDAYVGHWFVCRVSTTFTQVGSTSRATIQLQTSDTESFTSTANSATLASSSAFAATALTAGKIWAVRVPPNVKRYIRGYKSVSGTDGGNAFSAGALDMFITPDLDLEINKRYLLVG